MARVQLEFPEKTVFETKTRVRVSDLNYGNHLANDKLVAFLHQARVEFLFDLGESELDMFGVGLIVADCAIVYKTQAYLNDSIHIQVAIDNITRASFDMLFKLSNQHGQTVALAKNGMVCFNYAAQKVSSVPAEFTERFA